MTAPPVTDPEVDQWDVGAARAYLDERRGIMHEPIEQSADARVELRADRRFRLYSAAELDRLPPPAWIVENAIPRPSLVALLGAKGQGKTFVALDLSLSIASGRAWHGRSVQQGAVLYVYAEGPFGAKARVDAWCALQSYLGAAIIDRRSLPIWFLPRRLGVNNDAERALLLGEIRRLPAKPTLVVIDTLNQNLDGDEDGKGMSAFTRGCQEIVGALGAAVMVPHHTPLATPDRARGHGAFDGAIDVRLIVSRDADRVSVECNHNRYAAADWSLAFEAFAIAGSLALKPSDPTSGKLSGQRREILDLLHREGPLSFTVWRTRSDVHPSSFRKARKWLADNSYVKLDGAKYRATEAGILALDHPGSPEGHS